MVRTREQIADLNREFSSESPEVVLGYFLKEFHGKIALSSSLGAEDQVLTHIISGIDPQTRIFTLDTGRMFPENYDLVQKTSETYNIKIEVYFPQANAVEKMVREKGINLFYDSIENRKLCCHVRKLEPLKRAFEGLDIWICGLRAEQSVTRINTHLLEWDDTNGLLKLNPQFEWTNDQVWVYIHLYNIPYNPLHDKGFPSIGCQPCTRAIKPGEDIRAGRWWWEEPESKECGLHKSPVYKDRLKS